MMPDRINIGGGHEIEFVSFEDDPKTAINDYHKKPEGSPCQGFVSFKGGAWAKQFPDSGWDVISLEPLTLSPSLLCRTCGVHPLRELAALQHDMERLFEPQNGVGK